MTGKHLLQTKPRLEAIAEGLFLVLVMGLSLSLLYCVYVLPAEEVALRCVFAAAGLVLLGGAFEKLRRGRFAYLATFLPAFYILLVISDHVGKYGFLFYGLRIELLWLVSLAATLLVARQSMKVWQKSNPSQKERKAMKLGLWTMAIVLMILFATYFGIYYATIPLEIRNYRPEPFQNLISGLKVPASPDCKRNEALDLCVPDPIALEKSKPGEWVDCSRKGGMISIFTDVSITKETMGELPVRTPAEYMHAVLTARIGLIPLSMRRVLFNAIPPAPTELPARYYSIDMAPVLGMARVVRDTKRTNTTLWAIFDVKPKGPSLELYSVHKNTDQALLPLALIIAAMRAGINNRAW